MTENRNGQVVTFYSFKGGTGRTMALANVAWILATNGKRVLVADWDLESPGLHRFLNPFINAEHIAGSGGVINLIREFEDATRKSHRDELWHEQYARVQSCAFSVDWPFTGGGALDFLSAGRQNNDYVVTLGALDWDNFYDKLGGGLFFDALRADMQRNYDYTLIDSRTGLSDIADICTIHLPDILVDCFTFSEQGIDGAAHVARVVKTKYGARNIRILPVPMRVDQAEKVKADAGRAVAMQRFAGLPSGMTDEERRAYWAAVEVPYRPFYAYEETLATFGDQPGSPTSMLSAYEMLTRHITDGKVTAMPPMEETVRARGMARFIRRLTVAEEEITLRYAPEDQVWAEWIEQVLASAGVRVNDLWASGPPAEAVPPPSARELTIVSQASVADQAAVIPKDHGSRDPLAVYVADVRPLPRYPIESSAFVAGMDAELAAERILKLVGRAEADPAAGASRRGARFPGTDPVVFNAPGRNPRFTGREDDMRSLRAHLRNAGAAVVLPGALPVALQGMGGIGKTQVAMEYVHRFKAAYDVVWWIAADPATFIDTALADLGLSLNMPAQPTVLEAARSVLQSLGRGEPYGRWLLVFDNAEEIDKVGRFLPPGGGHVVITSRDRLWSDRATPLQVEVFERRESIAHLTQRLPTIKADEANRVADLLGDLPIAVAAAGAWLADTGTEVADYIQQIEQHGPSDLTVEATWDLSLTRLGDRSPAAYRLLQLCSVLGPEIALELVYGDGLAAALTPYDPTVSERNMRGRLVQQINRLALLKLDQPGGRIQVHRLLQHVVRTRMTEHELAEAKHQVHVMLAASRPPNDVDDPGSWQRFRMLWPHLEVSAAIGCADESVRQLLIDRIRYLWLRGDLPGGRDLGRRIDEAWTAMLRTMEESTEETLRRQLLHLRFNIGNIMRDQADFHEAYELNVAVLAEQAETLGATHSHTLMTSGSLAADMRALGRYAEALKRDKDTYALWSENFGDDHPRTLAAMNNLASSYRLVGDFRAAREMDQTVYQRRRVMRGFGEEHPYTLASASNLGRDLREAGDYERSISLLRTIIEIFKEKLGPNFRGTLNAQANLAVSLRSAGQAAEAAGLLDTAYERLLDTLGATGPDTVACRLSRSVNLIALKQIERASSELDAVHQAYQQSLGPTHPHTLICVNNVATVARALGDGRRARELAHDAAGKLGQTLELDHPHTLAALTNLAICTAEDGDPSEALTLMRNVAERLEKALGRDHPDTLRGTANLAMMLNNLEQPGPHADEIGALVRLSGRLGDGHPAVEALRDRKFLHRIVDPHPF